MSIHDDEKEDNENDENENQLQGVVEELSVENQNDLEVNIADNDSEKKHLTNKY